MYSFPLEETERILHKGMANLYWESQTYTGALYLTTERLVFVGYMMDITHKYVKEVALVHITEIKPEKTLFMIPNVIVISTMRDMGKIKFIVSGRDKWLADINKQIERMY